MQIRAESRNQKQTLPPRVRQSFLTPDSRFPSLDMLSRMPQAGLQFSEIRGRFTQRLPPKGRQSFSMFWPTEARKTPASARNMESEGDSIHVLHASYLHNLARIRIGYAMGIRYRWIRRRSNHSRTFPRMDRHSEKLRHQVGGVTNRT
jgi:hypothetical protein